MTRPQAQSLWYAAPGAVTQSDGGPAAAPLGDVPASQQLRPGAGNRQQRQAARFAAVPLQARSMGVHQCQQQAGCRQFVTEPLPRDYQDRARPDRPSEGLFAGAPN